MVIQSTTVQQSVGGVVKVREKEKKDREKA